MKSALRKIGNSTGLVVPKAILGQIGLTTGATLDLRVEDGVLIATPVRSDRRAGWAEAAAAIALDESESEVQADWLGFGNQGDTDLQW